MASFGKRQREQDRLAKAAHKRDRRQSRPSNTQGDGPDPHPGGSAPADESENEQVLAQIEALHRDFVAHAISFDTYEKQRDKLLERIRL